MENRLLVPGMPVSRLCYGTLTLGPLQRGMAPEAGGRLLIHALEKGIFFFDTAELYGTYPHLKLMLKEKNDAVVATKCYAYDAAGAEAAFAGAVKGLGREYVDVFMLHEQESEHTLRGHMEALEYFIRRREQGAIGAVGLSTHHVAAARAALRHPGIQVVHPLINMSGIGIADGTRQDMEQAVEALTEAGKGVYAMKALGGGHLIAKRREAFAYALGLSGVASVAVGMQSIEEIDYNAALFDGLEPAEELERSVGSAERTLHVHDWCRGCGKCAEACGAGAIQVVDGRARPDMGKCRLCGYCAAACPDFCIKVL